MAKIIDYTKNGKCPEGCCKCCSNLLVISDKEIDRIKKYINDNNITVNNPNTIFGKYTDICPFLNKEGKCNIYSVRPEICDYFYCKESLKTKKMHHKDKKVVNMLLTFKPDAFTPEDTPDVEMLDKAYQRSKERI